jgi:glycine betaine/proline transport system permease protein
MNTESEKQNFWQRLAAGKGGKRVPSLVKLLIGLVILAVLLIITAVLYNNVPSGADPGIALDFPEELDYGWDAIKWIDGIVDWVVINWEPFFDFILKIIVGILIPFRDFLIWLPWWLVVAVVTFAAWRMVSKWFALTAAAFMVIMLFMGLHDFTMMTLAIVLVATLLCVIAGVPIGILAAKNERFDNILRPVLDMMQTMPSFVYLIPALMLFGLGMTPAIMATCIYSIPPIIRLTNLGIRQVDSNVVEAGRSFGSTTWQLLTKVQIPLAMPTILAGLNQTIMMALAMVVLASMIGAGGLGEEVLRGIARVEPGRGFIGGTAIVFTAIILDRISQGFAKRPETQRGS